MKESSAVHPHLQGATTAAAGSIEKATLAHWKQTDDVHAQEAAKTAAWKWGKALQEKRTKEKE